MRLKIAARHSDLARLQAYLVGDALKKSQPSLDIEYQFRASLGDKNLSDPLWKMPEKGVFTEDFLMDLNEGVCDLVVHSWKDLPTEERKTTEIVSTLPRADARDILLIKRSSFEKIRETRELNLFSSSPRREYNLTPFLLSHFPLALNRVQFHSVRGNIPTRVKKLLAEDNIEGLVLAKAALDRLLLADQDEFRETRLFLEQALQQTRWMVLPLSQNPTAAAQGALAIEILKNRKDLKELLLKINCASTFRDVQEERTVLSSYGGGCHQKIGVHVMERTYGKVQSLRGLTQKEEVLNFWGFTEPQETWSAQEAWPLNPKDSQFFERQDCAFEKNFLETKDLWIARANALPEGYKPQKHQLIWCSGVETWKKLAQRGVWVNGSNDSLGEEEPLRLEALAPEGDWVKLSHADSKGDMGLPVLATYQLVPKVEIPKLVNKKYFFWMSGSSLEEALKHYPEIKTQGLHFCGPGNTWKKVRQLIKDDSRVRVCLSYQAWKESLV